MDVWFGTIYKEVNSTKQLSKDYMVKFDVQLKEDCSITDPVIVVSEDNWDITRNYCYIPKWNRYYFIMDMIRRTGSVWEIGLGIDVLATYKSQIKLATGYVERTAATDITSLFIPDSTWTHTSDITKSTSTIDFGLVGAGCFLLGVANDDTTAAATGYSIPSITVYACTGATVKNICNYMFSSDFFNSIADGIETSMQTLAKTVFNPFQYVIFCKWFPFSVSEMGGGGSSNISFGWWDQSGTSYSGQLVNTDYIEKTKTFTLGSYSNWTDRDGGWTKNLFYMPGFGQIELSPEYEGTTITAKLIVDKMTGDAGMFFYDSSSNLIQTASGKLGVDIQLSSLYEDVVSDVSSGKGLLSTAAKAGVGFFSGMASSLQNSFAVVQSGTHMKSYEVAGSAVKAGVTGAQSSLQPTMSTLSASGTRAIIQRELDAKLTIIKHTRLSDNTSTLGRMCCKTVSLSECSGYTTVVNPNVNIDASVAELTTLNSYLSSGFFME